MAKKNSGLGQKRRGIKPEKPTVRDLLASPDPLAKILHLTEDAIISVDEEQHIILFNRGAERIFGFAAQEVVGKSLDVLLPHRLVETHRGHVCNFAGSDMPARRMGERSEIVGRRKDGTEFPAEASISKVALGGRSMYTAILRDVTERAAAEKKIKTSLREKETLLREIHHRVKNNLQVVASLLRLQSRTVTDPLTRSMFQESQDRVHSMALLHENLYQADDLSRVDFREYIQQLASHLFRSYGVAAQRIHLRTNIDELYLNLDAAVPCGLIINEVVSNSLKHAFPDSREGEIRIELLAPVRGMARLVVADNGIGMPNETEGTAGKSLGMRLVRALAEQLGATIEVQSTDGTEVRLNFAAGA
jgi:PAS domain S-box-containing protein